MKAQDQVKAQDHKCGECHGTPRQHNIRDAQIAVRDESNGKVTFYPQHGFKFTGGN